MKTEVIILAQGSQKRLGTRYGFKQLLVLPEVAEPIMLRTTRQCVAMLRDDDPSCMPPVTIVCSSALDTLFQAWAEADPRTSVRSVRAIELSDPGNSSLKGIARYLESTRAHLAYGDIPERTIVLFGDVVYSWSCMRAIWGRAETCGWVGTADLSASGGELWGVAWCRSFEDEMMRMLRDALLRHPPFEDEYQPGQMRRWISGFRRGDIRDHVTKLRASGNYVAVDDYTNDIDLPSDIAMLPELSAAAATDDKANAP